MTGESMTDKASAPEYTERVVSAQRRGALSMSLVGLRGGRFSALDHPGPPIPKASPSRFEVVCTPGADLLGQSTGGASSSVRWVYSPTRTRPRGWELAVWAAWRLTMLHIGVVWIVILTGRKPLWFFPSDVYR
jgi:hypothetical protein